MFHNKPIIGLAGGIGSGKSYVAGLFAELGCVVIDADAAVRRLYDDLAVLGTLRQWWGDAIFLADGRLDRRAVARRVFTDPMERTRLEGLLHPRVAEMRQADMMAALRDRASLPAFVWDIPLLFENGLDRACDALVFIEAPLSDRLARVADRGWTEADLVIREKSQWGLDKKKQRCKDIIVNTAEHAADVRRQVGTTLSRILEITQNGSTGRAAGR